MAHGRQYYTLVNALIVFYTGRNFLRDIPNPLNDLVRVILQKHSRLMGLVEEENNLRNINHGYKSLQIVDQI